MSSTTFATYPVQSQNAAQAAPRSNTDHALSTEQSYLSAVSHQTSAKTAPAATGSYAPGPGMTTLALGEEDGGMAMAGDTGTMSTPAADSAYQVTTLAIGEEDGGGVSSHDSHAVIGSPYDPAPAMSRSDGHAQSGYGTMQPIYSPGEPEYPAFAKTSQTTDLLNFHPVARVPKTAVVQSAPVAAAPVSVTAPTTNQTVTMASTPVGALPQAAPQSTSFESVGSYDDYISGLTGETAAPASSPTYEPVAPSYDTQPAAPATAYEPFAPSYEKTAPAPSSYTAPLSSAEPQQKPSIGPSYTQGDTTTATPKAEATYVTVPIDAYLVEPGNTPPVPVPAATTEPAESAPAVQQEASSDKQSSAPPTPSLGGSYVVVDTPLPDSMTDLSAPKDAMKDAAPGLEIMTLAIGEEGGSP